MYWFTQPTEGTPDPAIATNTKTLVKSAAPTEVYWVEPRYGSIRFPRYRLELLLNENCGITDPTDCAVDGTLIWKEDFGGNDPAAPRISATGLPTGQTNYTYSSNDGVWTHGQYGLVKYSDFNGSNNWHSGFSDHTFANDKTRGYMFMTDASATVDMLYQHKIKGLCGGNLHISLWTANLVKQSYAETQHPTFRIELLDSVNTVIASYVTNNIPQFASPSWVNYGFAASIPAGYDSLTLRIYSNTVGSNAGNDFVFDDIEVRLCLPPVTITQPSTTSDTAVCAGSSVTLTGEFTNSDDTFDDDNLVAQWQYHPTGDINDPDGWTSLTTITTTPSTGEITGSITFVAAYSSAGYYRLIAADVANIGKANCRASSKLIHLNVIQAQIPPDIRVYVKPSAALTAVSLSSYIDSLPYSYTVQWNPAAEFTNIVTGMLNISGWTVPMTKIYTYSIISASCGTQTAKAYIRTIDSYGTNQRTVFICKELLLNGKLNLSRIFGIETDGSMAWSYPSDPDNVILNNISVTATGIHAGSRIFNAAKAFNEAGIAYDYPIGMKQFIIDYESGTVKKTVNLIVY